MLPILIVDLNPYLNLFIPKQEIMTTIKMGLNLQTPCLPVGAVRAIRINQSRYLNLE